MKIHPYLALVLIILLVVPFIFADIEYFSPLTLILLATPLIIGLPYIITAYKKRKIEKEEWRESISEGGIEEPRPFRDLTEEEKKILEKKHRWSQLILNNLWWLIPLFIIVDIFLGINLFRYWSDYASHRTGRYITEFAAFVFFIQIYLGSLAAAEGIWYSDLRSPVFRVQGKVIKEKFVRRSGTDYYVTVRKIRFSDTDYPDLKGMFEYLQDGDEIAVEYSPRTKRVWKMYKTEDLK